MTMTTRAEAEAAAGNLGRCSRYLPATWLAFDVGDKIVAATTDGHIMANDATRSQYTYDHDLRCWKPWTILLALSSRRRDDDMSMLVTTELLDFSEPDPHFEALRLTSGGRMQPLPVPPRRTSNLLPGHGGTNKVWLAPRPRGELGGCCPSRDERHQAPAGDPARVDEGYSPP
jgi:hypothetical protein